MVQFSVVGGDRWVPKNCQEMSYLSNTDMNTGYMITVYTKVTYYRINTFANVIGKESKTLLGKVK